MRRLASLVALLLAAAVAPPLPLASAAEDAAEAALLRAELLKPRQSKSELKNHLNTR